jgi:hypothetical protein
LKIGVGVEGPSDRIFWGKVLHKHFRGSKFDIRAMKNRQRLVRETPKLVETFRDAHYDACFIILDRNNDPCVSAIIDMFQANIRAEAKSPIASRYLHICVAVRELEAWFLADYEAIETVLPLSGYSPLDEAGQLNAEKQLRALWRKQYPNSAFHKRRFAQLIAPKFSPKKARRHSGSFDYFWKRLSGLSANRG